MPWSDETRSRRVRRCRGGRPGECATGAQSRRRTGTSRNSASRQGWPPSAVTRDLLAIDKPSGTLSDSKGGKREFAVVAPSAAGIPEPAIRFVDYRRKGAGRRLLLRRGCRAPNSRNLTLAALWQHSENSCCPRAVTPAGVASSSSHVARIALQKPRKTCQGGSLEMLANGGREPS